MNLTFIMGNVQGSFLKDGIKYDLIIPRTLITSLCYIKYKPIIVYGKKGRKSARKENN